MATCLATLSNLRDLYFGLQSPRPRPDRIGLPLPTRAVLPALTLFEFEGTSEYLEDLVARIDTPKLDRLVICLFMDLMFNIPQLHRYIARAESIRPLSPAKITFSPSDIHIMLGPLTGVVGLRISCKEPDWQASSMAQVFSQLSPLLSHVEQLNVSEYVPGTARQGNGIDPTQWFELFDPFSAVQALHIYDELRPLVGRALQELTGERATEVLPTLRSLFFEGPPPSRPTREDIQPFIAARQHSNYPVDVHWE